MTVAQTFDLAVRHHQAGRLAEAEALYRQILTVQPNHADALHRLGLIACQIGRQDLGVHWFRQAIMANPHNPAAHSNLGAALTGQGQLEEAIAACREAIDLAPDFAEAHTNLGNALRNHGHLEEAAAAYRQALGLRPADPVLHNNLGIALAEQGHLEEAIAVYRRALQIRPELPEIHNNLGNALKDRGRWEEALAAYGRALELKPGYPRAHYNLGNALRELGQLDEAVAAYTRALQLQPEYPEAQNNLGAALAERGQLDEAVAAYQRALELKADYPDACNNLGVTLARQGRIDEAIVAYRRALEIDPKNPEACNNLGDAFRARGQLDESLAACRRALELKPDYPDAFNNLGNVFKDRGQLDEAVAAFRSALQLEPDSSAVHSNVVYVLHFHPAHDEWTIDEEKRRWNRRFSEPASRFIRPHANDCSPERRLRIGYVSPDFREHVVGRNLLPLFKCHDLRNFDVLCYSGVVRPDGLTEEFRRHAGRWRDTAGLADEAFASLIREDGVDILVDLSQHTAGNRLPVFARQPAPVQVSFAGYPASTGLEAIKYRISDRFLEAGGSAIEKQAGRERPPGVPHLPVRLPDSTRVAHTDLGTEHLYLLDSFWCYDPGAVQMEVNALPAQESGVVTFGNLNNFCKINDEALRLWARVLGQVGESRLVFLSAEGSHRQRCREILERAGVPAQRVEMVAPRPRLDYLALYHRLDVILDTFPYDGHTTSLDALWMGVPVVSLASERPLSRAGLSQMSNLGLPELVAFSEDDYVAIAVRLAHDLPRLAELRKTLRPRMEASPLMDAPRFARGIEGAYRAMWRRWCAGRQMEKPLTTSL